MPVHRVARQLGVLRIVRLLARKVARRLVQLEQTFLNPHRVVLVVLQLVLRDARRLAPRTAPQLAPQLAQTVVLRDARILARQTALVGVAKVGAPLAARQLAQKAARRVRAQRDVQQDAQKAARQPVQTVALGGVLLGVARVLALLVVRRIVLRDVRHPAPQLAQRIARWIAQQLVL